ncbi:MAG: hypothetical protein RSD77_07320 [Romboutsia sp.]
MVKPIELKEHMLTLVMGLKISKYNYILIKNKYNTYKIHSNEKKYIEVQKRDMLIHTVKKDFELVYSLGKIEKEIKLKLL